MKKKATFALDENLLTDVKQVVESGLFRSASNLVEIAIRDALMKVKINRINAAILEASRDPLFLADIRDVKKDFATLDFATVDFEEGDR
ncbi:MAG: hypothetical protein RBG13Loki_1269 [Promethearchaeota archaeon CR_4]|nr:MAG: hypothetical protein RBG13Loki_1269 [Candidatus Lokiarchaeota archaeon CR_4]